MRTVRARGREGRERETETHPPSCHSTRELENRGTLASVRSLGATTSLRPRTCSAGVLTGESNHDSHRRSSGRYPLQKTANLKGAGGHATRGEGVDEKAGWSHGRATRAHRMAAVAAPWLKPHTPSNGPCVSSTVRR